MELETCRAHAIVKEENRILVRSEVEILVPKGYPKILRFYQTMAEAAIRWSEEILGEQARKSYAALPDVWAKARFLPLRFRLRGEPVYEDKSHFSIVCDAVFFKGNERQVRRAAQVWNKREETVLPPRQVRRFFSGQKIPRQKDFRADGCYPISGKMVLFQNQNAKMPFAERIFEISKQLK